MDQVISGGFGTRRPWSRDYIRIVTWNIERGLQFDAILKFLRTAQADLILLQEVDLNARRTHNRDVASELARSLRLNYFFGREFEELSEGSASSPAYHGQATLSPWPLSSGRIIRFHHQSNFWKPHWFVPDIQFFQRRLGGRIALTSEALIYGRPIVSYNLHLESQDENNIIRHQQLTETLEDARQYTESSSVLVAGDFNMNAGNGDADMLLHSAGFVDAVRLPKVPTTPVRGLFQAGRSIDWIYVSEDVRSEGCVHNNVRASDHYPVSVMVRR